MNKVKKVREEKGLTQQELADKASVSRYLISQLENDEELNITKNTMISIANALECKVTDIFLF